MAADSGVNLDGLLEQLASTGRARVRHWHDGRWQLATCAQLLADLEAAVLRLRRLGVGRGSRVGIHAPNSYSWLVHDLALLKLDAISVALPDHIPRASDDWIRDYDLALLLVAEGELADPSWVVQLDQPDDQGKSARQTGGPRPALSADVFTLVPSSGTSGVSKTLMVTRVGVAEVIRSFAERYPIDADDSVLMFLPFYNVQQRFIAFGALWFGLELVVSSPHLLLRSLRETSPTLIIGPPMFYEAIHRRFSNSTTPWQRALLGLLGAICGLLPGTLRRGTLGVLFGPIHQALGGRVRLMITGMAHIRVSTLRFFRRSGLELYEAYGLSESGLVAGNGRAGNRIGSVGRPFSGGQVHLADDGEIVVGRRRLVACGYWNHDSVENARVFIGNERVATGDLGRFDRDGYLYIVGRKKEVIVTGGGAKVQPEQLENAIRECPGVDQCAVVGGEQAAYLVAVVCLGNGAGEPARIAITRRIADLGRILPSGAQIRQTIWSDVPFTTDNGLLTRNLKLDRRNIAARFLTDRDRRQKGPAN